MKAHILRISLSALGLNLAIYGTQFVASILPIIPAAIFGALACGTTAFYLCLSISRLA